MKNGSKIKKIAPVLALTLPLALSAVLGAFATLKTAKADDILPPAPSNGLMQSSISTLNEFDITYGVIRPNSESVYMLTTIGHTVYEGQGVSTQTDLVLEGVYGGIYNGWYSIEDENVFMRITAPVTTDDKVYIYADYNGGGVYLDQNAYTQMFRAFGVYMPYTNASTFNPSHYTINAVVAKPIDDYIEGEFSLEYDTIVTDKNFWGASVNCELKDWYYFEQNGYVKNGYILLTDYVIQLTIPCSNASITTCSIAHGRDYYTAQEWEQLQNEAIQAYAPAIYSYIPVKADTIGLEVITNGIADILNTEFIPNFKLWYFLLIGLGVMITGLALKFFLGG